MSAIVMEVKLYNIGSGTPRLVGVNTKGVSGKPSFSVNAAANCVSSTYYGTAKATLYFPPGYSPSPQTVNVQSNTVPVSC